MRGVIGKMREERKRDTSAGFLYGNTEGKESFLFKFINYLTTKNKNRTKIFK